MPQIENAQQILDIIEPIPAEKFIEYYYGLSTGESCFIGHVNRALANNDYLADGKGFGARELTANFLEEKHGLSGYDGADVNNGDDVNGYNEPEIKLLQLQIAQLEKTGK